MFSQPPIEDLFAKYVLLRLYTDRVPAGVEQQPDAAGAVAFRNDKFGNAALPYYAIIRPNDSRFEVLRAWDDGLIRDINAFVRFLQEPLDGQS